LLPDRDYDAFGLAKSDRISAAGKHIPMGFLSIGETIFIHKAPLMSKKEKRCSVYLGKTLRGSASSSFTKLKPEFTIPI
jgi:hypothetical protein